MGGSSLAPEVFRRSLRRRDDGLRCTCSTRPTRTQVRAVARRARPRQDAVHRLLEVRRDDRDDVAVQALPRAARRDGAHFVAVTDPGTSLAKLGAEHGFRRVFESDPDIGGRYSRAVVLRARPGRARGHRRRRRARHRDRRRRGAAGLEQDNAGLWLGAALGELAPPGPRQADLRRRRAARRRSASGPSSSSPSRPASRAAASCRSPTSRSLGRRRLRRRPRVPARRAPATPRPRGKLGRARGGRPPGDHDPTRVGPTDLGRIFFLVGVRHRGRRLGAGDQPVRPAQRAGGQGQHQARARRGLARARGRATSSALLDGLAPPRYLAIMGYLPVLRRGRGRRSRACASALIERHHVATTCGYGPRFLHSTGQFHKGGPTVGRFLQLVRRRRTRTSRSPASRTPSRTLIRAQADGDLQTLRDHGLRRPCASAARRHRRDQGAALDADRLRRPREDGRQHGPSHPPRLGPRGRRVRPQRGRRRGRRGARRDRRRLARGPRRPSSRRRGWCGSWSRPATRPSRPIDAARRAARRGRHDRRRRQHQLARRRQRRAARARRARASTTSTSAPPAASGASRSATA